MTLCTCALYDLNTNFVSDSQVLFRQSLLGFIIVSIGMDGVLHQEYIDVCSDVSVQDSDWVLSAMTGHILPSTFYLS